MSILSNIVDDNKFTPEDVPAFETKIFFEGDQRRVNLERFAVLLFLSTVIATFGVIGDSVATVIGAMIIAPLMRPIMATAAALVMGRMGRALRSGLIVAVGVAGVIGVAWLLGALNTTAVISFENNSQIIGRISPRLIDLFAALASGADHRRHKQPQQPQTNERVEARNGQTRIRCVVECAPVYQGQWH